MSNGNGVVNEERGPGGTPTPRTPGALVLAHADAALLVQPVPQSEVDLLPSLEGSFELAFIARHAAIPGSKAQRGGGIILHTGLREECDKLRVVAKEILAAYGANIVEGLMALVNSQVQAKAVIHEAAKIVRPDGSSSRCGRCGKLKPCGCPGNVVQLHKPQKGG